MPSNEIWSPLPFDEGATSVADELSHVESANSDQTLHLIEPESAATVHGQDDLFGENDNEDSEENAAEEGGTIQDRPDNDAKREQVVTQHGGDEVDDPKTGMSTTNSDSSLH
jgi:hypothetical protein